MLHLVANLYFNNADFISTHEVERLDLLLFSMDVIVIIAISVIFLITLTERLLQRRSIAILASSISNMFVSAQQELQHRRHEVVSRIDAELQSSRARDEHAIDDEIVPYTAFESALKECLQGTATALISSKAEAVFLILQLVHDEEDEHATEMSPMFRAKLIARKGLPRSLVQLDYLSFESHICASNRVGKSTRWGPFYFGAFSS
jgi:hypothetical protein